MTRHKISILAAALFAFLGGQGLFADQLVTNGGFETGDFTGWTLSGLAATFTPASSQYGLVTPSALGLVASGNYAAYLGSGFGPNNLILSQNLAVVPGNSYTVTFSLFNGVGYVSNLPNGFQVTFDGQTLLTLINTSDTTNSYENYSFLVTIPTTGTATAPIAFSSYAGSGFFYLDNVSVSTATPEPATFLLLAPVLAGLALLRRKRS